jgi:adenylate cyclase
MPQNFSGVNNSTMEVRKLAAIMFTDIVGYTRLMGSDETKAFEILRKNRRIQKPIIRKYRGKWLKEMGDGILASFDSVTDAIHCAAEIQHTAKKQDIGLRIGIHLGEVVFEDEDVLGDGVNVASRLEELAEPGCIYVSGAIYKNVKNKEGITAEFMGEKTLKNVDEPLKIYKVKSNEKAQREDSKFKTTEKERSRKIFDMSLISVIFSIFVVALLVWFFVSGKKKLQPENSIAVLPFINDSPDKDNEYFCNGMMDEILTHLQKISDLQVKSRTAVEKYRNSTQDPIIIGAELGVSYLVEGSVRKVENDIRIIVQLINTNSGNHVWAEPYDGEYSSELLKFQSEVARKIVNSINAEITKPEKRRIEKTAETNIDVYDNILKARELINQYWATHNRDYLPSILYFINKALDIDPDSPIANSAMGYYFVAHAFRQKESIRVQSLDSALYYSDIALDNDPESFLAYRTKARAYRYFYNWEKAVENISKAIILAPNDVESNRLFGYVLLLSKGLGNDFIDGLHYLQKAVELYGENSADGLFWKGYGIYYPIGEYVKGDEYILKSIKAGYRHPAYHSISWSLLNRNRTQNAIQFLDTIVEKDNYDATCHYHYLRAYIEAHKLKKAEEKLKFIQQKYGKGEWLKIVDAYLLIRNDRIDEGKAQLNEIKKEINRRLSKKKSYGNLSSKIIVHSILNEKDQALKSLSELVKSYMLDSNYIDFYKNFILLKNIQNQSRFKMIMKQAEGKLSEIKNQISD